MRPLAQMVRTRARRNNPENKKVMATVTTSSPAKKRTVSDTTVSVNEINVLSTLPLKKSKTKSTHTSAWGALFAAPMKTSQACARPMTAKPVSSALQAKIDAFPLFDNVSTRSDDNVRTKLVAWNVNGLRAVLKRDDSIHLRAYVAQEDPDIFCLSETKICCDELKKLEDFLPHYKHQFWSCAVKKGYASTAIFSKIQPLSVRDELIIGNHESKGVTKAANGEKDQEGRFLALEFDKFWLVHTYVPNAGSKLERLDFRTKQWDKAMLREMKEMEKSKPVIWCGDLNVAHQTIDIHDPKGNRKSAGFTVEERQSFSEILDSGFVDTFRHLHPDKVEYSFFGYRNNMRAKKKGWRLDYFVVSKALMPIVVRCLLNECELCK